MAVEKFNFLDESGVQALATYILRGANSRIKERIIDSTVGITADAYNDDNHVLAAKVLLGLIGNIDNFDTTIDGTGNTVLDKVKALKNAIGTAADGATTATVYGEIAKVRTEISALTHLTYQVVTGDIETQVPAGEAKTDVIYLQHDEPSYSVGNDGFLLAADGSHAAGDGYEAYVDPATGVVYKVVDGAVTTDVVADDDAIYANVAQVEDTTYNLYIYNKTGEDTYEWLCVGDTSISLSNYWDKSDASVNELKNLIMEAIAEDTISSAVATAFANTDPYTGDNAYLDEYILRYIIKI